MSIFNKTKKEVVGNAEAIITVADLRKFYGLSFSEAKDPYFENLILVAQKACASYMGMDTLRQLYSCSEYIETVVGQKEVILTGQPLVSIQHVYDGDREVTEFLIDLTKNVLRFTHGVSSSQVRVEYTIGWEDEVPADVKFCVAQTVGYMARMANSTLYGKNSMNTEGGSETYEQSVVPLALRTYLDRYRQHRMN